MRERPGEGLSSRERRRPRRLDRPNRADIALRLQQADRLGERRLEALAEAGGLRTNLRSGGVSEAELPELAADAAQQWTGTFNPRPLDQQGAIEIYQCVY